MDIFAEHIRQYVDQENERIHVCEILCDVADCVGAYVSFQLDPCSLDINPDDPYGRAGKYRHGVWYPLQSTELPPGDSARRRLFTRMLRKRLCVQADVHFNGIVWLDTDLEVIS